MSNDQKVRLRARPVAPLFLAAGLVLGTVLGWYVHDFTATRDVVAEAKVATTAAVAVATVAGWVAAGWAGWAGWAEWKKCISFMIFWTIVKQSQGT